MFRQARPSVHVRPSGWPVCRLSSQKVLRQVHEGDRKGFSCDTLKPKPISQTKTESTHCMNNILDVATVD